MSENREELHDLRQQAHEAGIEGNSTMDEEQLRTALKAKDRGASPEEAKQTGRDGG